jgi:hypothetical protein
MHKTLQRLQRECLLRDPPHLDATQREGRPSQAAIKREAAAFEAELPASADAKVVQAILFLAHDHLDIAAKLLGKRDDPVALYLIGIIHRRRCEYAEACRCFRMVRELDLHLLTGAALLEDDEPMVARVLGNFPNLVLNGRFNPVPMAGIVQQVCLGGHAGLGDAIRRVQAIELATILARAAGWGHRRLIALQRRFSA